MCISPGHLTQILVFAFHFQNEPSHSQCGCITKENEFTYLHTQYSPSVLCLFLSNAGKLTGIFARESLLTVMVPASNVVPSVCGLQELHSARVVKTSISWI